MESNVLQEQPQRCKDVEDGEETGVDGELDCPGTIPLWTSRLHEGFLLKEVSLF